MTLEALASRKMNSLFAENYYKEPHKAPWYNKNCITLLEHFPTCLFYVLSTFGTFENTSLYGTIDTSINAYPRFVSFIQCQTDHLTDVLWTYLYNIYYRNHTTLFKLPKAIIKQNGTSYVYKGKCSHICTFAFSHPKHSEYNIGVHEVIKSKLSLQDLAQFEVMKSIICNIRMNHPLATMSSLHQLDNEPYIFWKKRVIRYWINHYKSKVEQLTLPLHILEKMCDTGTLDCYEDHIPQYYFPFPPIS
jgi:hypothetical protein